MTTPTETDPRNAGPSPVAGVPRRPVDLFVGVAGLLLLAAVLIAVRVATGPGQAADTEGLRALIPSSLLFLVALGANLFILLLFCVSALRALFLRRLRDLARSSAAGVAAYGLASLVNAALAALVGSGGPTLSGTPGEVFTSASLGYVAAAIAVARTLPHGLPRVRAWLWGATATATVSAVLAGVTSFLALLVTVLVGLACGALALYAVGTRAAPTDLVRSSHEELARFGMPADLINPAGHDHDGNPRFLADLTDGSVVELSVLSSENTSGFWRRLRDLLFLRGPVAPRMLYGVRRRAEHAALMGQSMRSTGAHTPRVLAVGELSPGTVLLVREVVAERSFDTLTPEEITDQLADRCWHMLGNLRRHRLAHGDLSGDTLGLTGDGGLVLTGVDRGTVAAPQLRLSLDSAALVTLLALRIGERRAVDSAVRALGVNGTAALLPFLQPAGLPYAQRARLRADRGLLARMREHIVTLAPEAPAAPARLERMRPRTVVSVVVVTVVGFVLLNQLTGVDFATIVGADLSWSVAALVMATVCMVAAAMVLIGFVPLRLPWWRTVLVQYAGSFVRIAAPAGLGSIAINSRFVVKAGASTSLALSAVGLSQVVGFLVHVPLLLVCAYLTGTSYWTGFTPSPTVVLVCLAATVAIGAVLLQPRMRRAVGERVRPYLSGVLPRLLDTLQSPGGLILGLGGTLLLTIGFVLCLHFSVLAFTHPGEEVSLVAVAVVFLAGNAVGSAAPTPGGLGAVEAALIGGLTAVAGIPAAVALPAVLLFRLLTFWLPVLPGWAAFSYLQRREAI
ncbi:lysylphosphatidylglycerol synthase transmembrane domain-containing protein [Nocardiopsis kunsanensis]|uniref:lysylphosphatidylglycerol synthase transmembrane domain-containing protein n=1 Tax=Nocardiopsis kunsanensis TaxID=141693 RepID=UPI001876C1F8|nr:lysylphosphatidylglycerol synthase transmembrane domain-containing protein [Nocardiopsis kunsanensis]